MAFRLFYYKPCFGSRQLTNQRHLWTNRRRLSTKAAPHPARPLRQIPTARACQAPRQKARANEVGGFRTL